MADEDVVPEMQQRMADAISSAMVDGEMVLKFLCIAEVIDSDGDRCLWAVAPDEANSWDTLGLLNWALARENASATLQLMAEMQEDCDGD